MHSYLTYAKKTRINLFAVVVVVVVAVVVIVVVFVLEG